MTLDALDHAPAWTFLVSAIVLLAVLEVISRALAPEDDRAAP